MAEPTAPGATQADAGGTPQAGDETKPQAGSTTADAAPQAGGGEPAANPDETPNEAALRRELREARTEAGKYRTQLRTYEDAAKTELTRATDRVAELERELADERSSRQADRLDLASQSAARKLGFRSPELAARLISPADVEYDDAGKPRNVDELLKAVAKQDPYLVNGKPDFGGGPRGAPAGGTSDMNEIIRRGAGRG